ncbi:hypothetical protein [Leisingera sp. ANG-S5]|uniref:hypothetical protein n=1 Tax=Leisingera sp. ANG-S5 TaxID=1577901 RepID=UPI00057ED524|nr:hypothetical protein [Leisingera sp. ANG-S5]KIC29743.1 hypothetical protein RA25_19905 [Leisingera sp. ANG-S5]
MAAKSGASILPWSSFAETSTNGGFEFGEAARTFLHLRYPACRKRALRKNQIHRKGSDWAFAAPGVNDGRQPGADIDMVASAKDAVGAKFHGDFPENGPSAGPSYLM